MQDIQHLPNRVLAGVALGLTLVFSESASATLTAETSNGVNLVYNSGSNTTWTQDANLLGTWEGAYHSTSYTNIVNAIIQASNGVIHDTPNGNDPSGTYTLTPADFGSGGTLNWWAGQALVHYLDTLNYGGSNQWALPSSNAINGYNTGSQLGELFFNELGGVAGSSITTTHNANYNLFSNLQASGYWTGTEYALGPIDSWVLYTDSGFQHSNFSKVNQFYAWAVSPGHVSAVPAPGAVWLFGSAFTGLICLKRRKKVQM